VYDPLDRVIQKIDAYGKVIEEIVYNDNNQQIKSYKIPNSIPVTNNDFESSSGVDPSGGARISGSMIRLSRMSLEQDCKVQNVSV
jgi:hypothetical protein